VSAWNAVFTEQMPRVYNYFCYRLDNEADIQELTSRTFEKAWRAQHRYRRERAAVGTWLLRIAHGQLSCVKVESFRSCLSQDRVAIL
jgi:DNA-directed RNA polymerase specialized sigma24 family protein